MGMDPMAMSQGMYGGYGGQGMGMSGMNVGMGFNAGQSAFGGYNGQPTAAWNAGQDKFNQNTYGGHAAGMGGDFGTNAGYGGYNMPQHQGNFTQMHHHQFQNNDFQSGYNGQGFHNRGRGRGRGYQNTGRGRGGLHQVNPGNQANYEPFHHQLPNQLAQQDPPHQQSSSGVQKGPEQPKQTVDTSQQAADPAAKVEQVADEQLAKELEPGDTEDPAETVPKSLPIKQLPVEGDDAPPTEPSEAVASVGEQYTPKQSAMPEKEKPAAIETFISSDPKEPEIRQVSNAVGTPTAMMPPPTPTIPLGPAALYAVEQSHEFGLRGRGVGRGLHRGASEYRGGLRGRGTGFISSGVGLPSASAQPIPSADIPVVVPTEPKGLGVEGAPKAPKALREGLPNTSMRGGRGFAIIGRASNATQARPNGHARSRRCVQTLQSVVGQKTLLIEFTAPPRPVPALQPGINLIDTARIVIDQQAAQMRVSRKGVVSATVVTVASMKTTRTVNHKNSRNRSRGKSPSIPPPGDRLIEATASMGGKRMQAEVIIVLTGRRESEVGSGMGNHAAVGSDQDRLQAK